MKTRGSLCFHASLVWELATGRKRETRRVVKPHHYEGETPHCPFEIGEELFVKESFRLERVKNDLFVVYADDSRYYLGAYWRGWERYIKNNLIPSFYMPREISRLWLRVLDCRLERLQELDEAGARKEGFEGLSEFIKFWNHIHPQKPYRWESNPLVWVLELKVSWWKGEPDG